jgi:acyl-coenzyme A synthetase/AMP-(fatty) acid ligase
MNRVDALGFNPCLFSLTLVSLKVPEMLVAGLAVWRLGAVYVPLFTAFAEHAIDYRCRHR